MQNTEIDGFQLYTQEISYLETFLKAIPVSVVDIPSPGLRGERVSNSPNGVLCINPMILIFFTPTCFAGSNDSRLFKPFVWLIQGLSQRKVI